MIGQSHRPPLSEVIHTLADTAQIELNWLPLNSDLSLPVVFKKKKGAAITTPPQNK
jgi:hypothetical protein